MEISFPYTMPDTEAKERLDLLGKYLTNRHGINVSWVDDKKAKFSGKYLVVKIEGELTLGAGKAAFKGQDPGWPWRKKAEDYIRGKIAHYLDPKIATKDLPTQKDD